MIIGLDIGASATKLAGYDSGRVLFTASRVGKNVDIDSLIADSLTAGGFSENEIRALAVTGVGADKFLEGECRFEIRAVPEIEATGEGGLFLSGLDEAVVVSVGTGTSIVLARDGAFTHVGGSGVGSGTLRGLAKKLSGITDLPEYFALAEKGNYSKVDIQIRDLFSGTDTLPPDLTASNLAKCSDEGTERDWAAAVINMVLEVAGSHAALACAGFGVDRAVITGGLTQAKIAGECYAKFDRLYKPEYIIPEHSGFATAIGAARRADIGD